jgi:ribosomal protein L37AE/L43A
MNIREYPCPVCDEDVKVEDRDRIAQCDHCKVILNINTDADFDDGRWKDLTTLSVRKIE